MVPTRAPLSRWELNPGLRIRRAVVIVGTAFISLACQAMLPCSADAATARSRNFEVIADSEEVAGLLADYAEELRARLASEWLESELPAWERRCIVRVNTGRERLSGDTTYTLAAGRTMRWQMELRGPVERIVETLLPHEVLHAVLASHYRCAVPRWADEGAALSVEPEAERGRLWAQEGPALLRGRRQALADLFACDQYPDGRDSLRAFYAQGASVTEFLLLGGKSQFVAFVGLGMQAGWEQAAAAHYGFSSIASLESAWLAWLHDERPTISLADGQLLSDAVGRLPHNPSLTAELPVRRSSAGAGGAQ